MNVFWRLVALACLCALPAASPGRQIQRPPNFIIVYADDLGYADIGPFSTRTGAARPQTPNLDRMAAEGIRLTDFYVAAGRVFGVARGAADRRYPNRVGIQGALNHTAQYGINPRRDDAGRSPEAARLRDGHLRQVAPGPSAAVSAAAARLRRVLRPAVLERHVAAASDSRRTSIPTCR